MQRFHGRAIALRILGALAVLVMVTACSERLEWRELKSADGYAVLLPGRAQTVAREVEFEGQRLALSMTSTGVGPTLFAVGVARLPSALAEDAAARERAIAYFRDALVRNIGGQVTASGTATLAGPEGARTVVKAAQAVEARGRGGDGRPATLAARFFIVDDRLFEVIAVGGEGALDPNALDTYFTSFRVLPGGNP
jgi:hypothetical protein